MNNAALIEKLGAAKEGTRALSDEVLLALEWTQSKPDHWKIGEVAWKKPSGKWAGAPPDPTCSLDDAMDLVPEREGTNKAAFLYTAMYQLGIGDIPDEKLAIFACIALLKAMEQGDD